MSTPIDVTSHVTDTDDLPGVTKVPDAGKDPNRKGRVSRSFELGDALEALDIHVGVDTVICNLLPIAEAELDRRTKWIAIVQTARPYALEYVEETFACLLRDLEEASLDQAIPRVARRAIEGGPR